MINLNFNRFFFLLLIFFPLTFLYSYNPSGGHRGNISALVYSEDTLISAGEDGYIVIWNISEKAAAEQFQLTPYSIKSMIKHPSRAEICIVEEAGIDDYRISAWNYRFKDKLFSIRSKVPVALLNYSANGSYIITAGLEGLPFSLIDSGTGEIIVSPSFESGTAALAITGRNERSMLLYQSDTGDGGQILYLDLGDNASVTGSFQTLGNLARPIIFGNRRYLAGINSGGLFVIDAASGAELANFKNIERNALLCPSDDGFFCLGRRGAQRVLYSFSLDRNGRPVLRQELPIRLPAEDTRQISVIAHHKNTILASAGENLFIIENDGSLIPMVQNFQTRVKEIAASFNNIAILTENDELCLFPLDYNLLENIETLSLIKKTGFSQITSLYDNNQTKVDQIKTDNNQLNTDRFILWQNANTRYTAQIINQDNSIDINSLKFLPGRFPLRAISSAYNKLLALDSAGNLSVFNARDLSSKAEFTFSSIGAIDAVFIDNEHIILCRSAISGNSPFLYVNIKTGETVPFFTMNRVPFSSTVGIMVHSTSSGKIYAAAVETEKNEVKTVVLKLIPPTTAAGASAGKIFEYSGEDANLSLAESGGKLAIKCGSEGAAIYADEIIYFERTEGLPVKLMGSDKFFLCVDSEGNISWHDNKTGNILAVLKIFEDRWFLTTGDRGTGGSIERGLMLQNANRETGSSAPF